MHLVSQLSFVFVKIVDIFMLFSLSLSLSLYLTDSLLSFSLFTTFGIINSIVVVPELLLLSVSVSLPSPSDHYVLCFFCFALWSS